MFPSSVVKLSHQILDRLTNSNDIIIDATLGNGYDSLYLSNLVSHIYSFDIQKQALDNSEKTLQNVGNVSMILDSHLNYQNYVKNYHGVIFNLGYLPTGNKSVTTTSKTTISTLEKMIQDNLARFILLVVYPGHDEGYIESHDLQKYLENISNYNVNYNFLSDDDKKAYIILLTKKSSK